MHFVQNVVNYVVVLLRIFQCIRCYQFQHEGVRGVAAIATRLAAAEILAGVRRWGFESDAAAMAAEAETICLSVKAPAWRRQCAWFVRVAQERMAEATGRRLRQAEGDGAPDSVGKRRRRL